MKNLLSETQAKTPTMKNSDDEYFSDKAHSTTKTAEV